MKRNSSILTFLLIMFSSLVSAGPVEGVEQLADGINDVIVIIIEFISDTLFDIESFDEFLFAKILIFIIIIIITYTILRENEIFGSKEKNKWVYWIIASSVAILSTRFMPDNFVEAIILQYNTFGTALTIFLPLMIYFFFIHQSKIGPAGRRLGWIFYGMVFTGLWISRYSDLGEANLIYWLGIFALVVCFIFDKKIHEYFALSDYRKTRKSISNDARVHALRELKILMKDEADGLYKGKRKEFEEKQELLEKIIKENS